MFSNVLLKERYSNNQKINGRKTLPQGGYAMNLLDKLKTIIQKNN